MKGEAPGSSNSSEISDRIWRWWCRWPEINAPGWHCKRADLRPPLIWLFITIPIFISLTHSLLWKLEMIPVSEVVTHAIVWIDCCEESNSVLSSSELWTGTCIAWMPRALSSFSQDWTNRIENRDDSREGTLLRLILYKGSECLFFVWASQVGLGKYWTIG